jgi:hypothetical protein
MPCCNRYYAYWMKNGGLHCRWDEIGVGDSLGIRGDSLGIIGGNIGENRIIRESRMGGNSIGGGDGCG